MNALIMRSRSVSEVGLSEKDFEERWRGEYGERWNIPFRYRFYRWDYLPYVDSKVVERFYKGADIVYNNWKRLRGMNIYLYGDRRTCKTAIVCIFLKELVKKGFNCFYVNYGELAYLFNSDMMLNEDISIRDWMNLTHVLVIDDLETNDDSYEDKSEMKVCERLLKSRMDDLNVNIIISRWNEAELKERWKNLYEILEGKTIFIKNDVKQINIIDDEKSHQTA